MVLGSDAHLLDMVAQYLFWFRVEETFAKAMERFDRLDERLEIKVQAVHPLDGGRLPDNQDMCLLLGVCKRTTARYRQKKLVAFYKTDRKIFYKASERRKTIESLFSVCPNPNPNNRA